MATIALPRAYALTLGTASAQILPINLTRKGLFFLNGSGTITVAFCPSNQVVGGNLAALAAAVNGAGSYTLLPLGSLWIPQIAGLDCGCAWNAIATSPGTPLTVWEF